MCLLNTNLSLPSPYSLDMHNILTLTANTVYRTILSWINQSPKRPSYVLLFVPKAYKRFFRKNVTGQGQGHEQGQGQGQGQSQSQSRHKYTYFLLWVLYLPINVQQRRRR